ncbi:S-layer homology domain-containing protein [Aneurinibacillus tyrosinisolvens]|uniref:S-layer homology domain-containing protein n=1 Tax=Aneurinibacillus tyrosinisolvens TaxID=1443435 RepID=UPI00063EEE4F|nr:S-layer homology domain-containing protein [Aneurinibacillus tyrosinisolvens]
MQRKWLAGCLTAALLYVTPVQADNSVPSFTDIEHSYAKEAILSLAGQGIVNGVGSGKFAPEKNMARKHFAVVIAKSLGAQPFFPEKPTFVDMSPQDPEYGYVEALVKIGALQLAKDGNFRGNEPVREQDAAAVLYLATGLDTMKPSTKAMTRAQVAVLANTLVQSRTRQALMAVRDISPQSIEVKAGEKRKIDVRPQQEAFPFTPVFGFSNPAVGSVSADGVFTAQAAGTGIVTVNVGYNSYTVEVRVIAK